MDIQTLIYTNPLLTILAISFIISLLSILATKIFTDQKELKRIREEIKKLQKELKKVAGKNPERAKTLQKKLMELTMQSTRHSLRVTIFTIIPLILIFGWMKSSFSYAPLAPDQPVQVIVHLKDFAYKNVTLSVINKETLEEKNYTGFISQDKKTAKFLITFPDYGNYILRVRVISLVNNKPQVIEEQNKEVLVDKYKYTNPISKYKLRYIDKIEVEYKPLRLLGNFSIFGWHPGWFSIYFFSSLFFITLFRKLFNVY